MTNIQAISPDTDTIRQALNIAWDVANESQRPVWCISYPAGTPKMALVNPSMDFEEIKKLHENLMGKADLWQTPTDEAKLAAAKPFYEAWAQEDRSTAVITASNLANSYGKPVTLMFSGEEITVKQYATTDELKALGAEFKNADTIAGQPRNGWAKGVGKTEGN
jgi:hypothetical protein